MEKELKFKILNKDDYSKIVNIIQKQYEVTTLLQKNYYYDTENMLLLKNDSILRARIEQEKVIITYKRQKDVKDGYFVSEEIEEFAQIKDFEKVLSGEKYILDVCSKCKKIIKDLIEDLKLVLIGKIETERMYFYYENLKFEIDKVNFGNFVFDYEIEVESENEKEAKNKLIDFFNELNIIYEAQTKTKFQRFLEKSDLLF